MSPWPWHEFTIDSAAPIDDVSARLAEYVRSEKRFEGDVRGGVFELKQRTDRRDGMDLMAAIVEGRIERHGAGCRATVHTRLPVAGMAFGALWVGGWGLATILQLFSWMSGLPQWPLLILSPVMTAFGWVMVASGFWTEAVEHERVLREVFAAASRGSDAIPA